MFFKKKKEEKRTLDFTYYNYCDSCGYLEKPGSYNFSPGLCPKCANTKTRKVIARWKSSIKTYFMSSYREIIYSDPEIKE